MTTLISNKLALRNPIPEEVQSEFLSDCCRVVYHLEMTDYDIFINERFHNWDDLVRFVRKAPEIFEHTLGALDFKIWTEMEDFSDSI